MNKIPNLITDNPELLLYLDGKLHVTILGGIRLTGLDRLKVTLKLVSTDNKQNIFRHNLDLYNSIQAEQLIEKAAPESGASVWRWPKAAEHSCPADR
jgi:hypothetical protein